MSRSRVTLSVVVVAYDMQRELTRTLRSLSPPYQRGFDGVPYEVVVVDNGSPVPLSVPSSSEVGVEIVLHRIDDASSSPARAANLGIELARGDIVGLIVDGARMASPGLLDVALLAHRSTARAIVTAPAWHLRSAARSTADLAEQRIAEDALLEQVAWERDGYELFSVATPAKSSARGLLGAMGESSSLFLRRDLWAELGGLDERFALPGGGLVNHDLYRRACALPDAQLVVIIGEGTFHQQHGGAATSGRVSRDEMRADYEAIRGEPHQPPASRPRFVGSVPRQYLDYLAASVELAAAASGRTSPTMDLSQTDATDPSEDDLT